MVGDLFNSGRQDIVANQMDKPPALFKNVHANQNHWVQFKLIGGPKSPRDAIGAKVYVTAGGIRRCGDVMSAEGVTRRLTISECILDLATRLRSMRRRYTGPAALWNR